MKHPAKTLTYNELYDKLQQAVAEKFVSKKRQNHLELYCYTPHTVYNKAWTDITLIARGLILDTVKQEIVATPFPKFFNWGEMSEKLPIDNFSVTEKLDGSLIIIWWDKETEEWRTATKGSFVSDQARDAQSWLNSHNLTTLVRGFTYLCEWVGPENKIVVKYDKSELVLLSIYDDEGFELEYDVVSDTACSLGWRYARQYKFESLKHLIDSSEKLDLTTEGFVIHWKNGYRLKLKGEEYKRIHRCISRCTPLAVWDGLFANDNMQAMREQLPEEFWEDFDNILNLLLERQLEIYMQVKTEVEKLIDWSDKDIGLQLNNWQEPVRSLIFPMRKGHNINKAILRLIRPTGNILNGYAPSHTVLRVQEETL